MTEPLKILFSSDLNPFSKGYARLRAFEALGCTVQGVANTPLGDENQGSLRYSLAYRIGWRLGYPLDTEGANKALRDAAAKFHPDVVWIDKGVTIRPATLRHLRRTCPEAVFVAYSEDDMALRHNHSRFYVRGLRYYDAVFTTKSANLDEAELEALGARRVHFVHKAFDPVQHRPVPVNESDRVALGAPVGFVGTFEGDRARSLLSLAEAGIPVRVWGNGWEALAGRHPNLLIEGAAVVNLPDDPRYSRTICATDINLGFLRKLNRDRQTDRSVEIPACGGFMLAERSAEHQAMFAEGREADYFGDDAELLRKVRFYLDNPERRAQVAAAGHARCLADGYAEPERLRLMLQTALGRTPPGPA